MSNKIEAPKEEKPLNQTQVKNLREIVDGDFADLRMKLRQQIEERFNAKRKEIEERHRDVDLDAVQDQIRKVKKSLESQVEQLTDDLKSKGYRFGGMDSHPIRVEISHRMNITHEQKQKELDALNKAKKRILDSVEQITNREQRSTERLVLLQSLSATAALEILRDLPAAEDLLPAVAAETMQQSDEDDVKLLLGDIEPKELEEGDA